MWSFVMSANIRKHFRKKCENHTEVSVTRLTKSDSWNINSKRVGRKRELKSLKHNEPVSLEKITKASTANFYPRKATYLLHVGHQLQQPTHISSKSQVHY